MSCTDKNPLIREGTSLLNRVLAALAPGYAKVDERDPADLLLFAKRYSTCLNYYDETNTLSGDWQDLMRSDVSVTLATLAKINVQEISDYKKRIYKNIRLASSDADAKLEFKYLFDLLFSLVAMLDEQFRFLPADFEYKNILTDTISRKLQLPLANLEFCFNDYKSKSELDYSTEQLDNDSPIHVVSDGNFKRSNLSSIWNTVAADISITNPPALPAKDFIVYIINHNLFNGQIDALLNGVSSVVNRANDLFVQTLGNYPNHTPHFALFIAFIEIFRHAQDDLNLYTKDHLDFYYKDVLQLSNQAPDPDSAHLLFELQKNATDHLLTKNTLFKGGKDITGTEINYALTDDVVITKATISKIQSQQIIRGTRDILKVSSIANSDDGQGARLTTVDKSWFTFGDVDKIKNAKPGFALASNILFLNEGARIVIVLVKFKNPLTGIGVYNSHCFTAQFTGKKKWETISQVSVIAVGSELIFYFTLNPDDPAIVPYSEKVHAQNMNGSLPVLEIFLNQDIPNAIPYTFLCNREILAMEIAVEVNGLKNLMLSNDSGSVDASKPFKPFGNFPESGTSAYIGSKEIFQKNLTRLDLNTDWKVTANTAAIPALNATASYLSQNNFNISSYQYNLSVNGPRTTASIVFPPGSFPAAAIDFSANERLAATTIEGFLRIRLDDSSFSLQTHLANVSASLSHTSISNTSNNPTVYTVAIPAAPVPVDAILNNFSVNYTATANISFQSGQTPENNMFYHIGDLGSERVDELLSDQSGDPGNTSRFTLLKDIENEGELFIGLENAMPGSEITILFQVEDGSSNPLLDIETLKWFYLAANNSWKKFNDEDVVDNTNNFTQSGVVSISLPADIDNNNTLLQNGLHWIKITAHPYTDAVCKMIQIQAQAARVQLVQDDTKNIEFRQLLPANSISKLLVSDAALKTISQPFDSFDGRIRETDDGFYVRVSERLRHKQRAITIWDYEHIVLQKFQKIFKVKCINQAGFYTEQGEDVFCENYPGHVSVITIPDQNKNTIMDPLRPYTPIGLLNNISDYLKTVISPFVKLHVKNPQFEEVQLEFEVSFYPHMNPDFYKKQLNDDIEQFLCPWAFGNTKEISFGGKIYKSTLINFIEERPYVDFITCVKMNQYINRGGAGSQTLTNVEEVVASTARSILVSYHDGVTRHIITTPANCVC